MRAAALNTTALDLYKKCVRKKGKSENKGKRNGFKNF